MKFIIQTAQLIQHTPKFYLALLVVCFALFQLQTVFVHAASPNIIGYYTVTKTSDDAGLTIQGWACQPGSNERIKVRAIRLAPAEKGGYFVDQSIANETGPGNGDTVIKNQCGSSFRGQRFTLRMSGADLHQYGGQALYVYGVATDNQTLIPLTLSGGGTSSVIPFVKAKTYACKTGRTCFYPQTASANTKSIVRTAPPDTSVGDTRLVSDGATFGFYAGGGGYLNYFTFPDSSTDIVGPLSSLFGRGAQSSIRDQLHSGVYNPTQAGFTAHGGTSVQMSKTKDGKTINMPSRQVVLFDADRRYDFTQNENLTPDLYANDGGNSDMDHFTDVPGRQDLEVKSEFDYKGNYSDCSKTAGIACVRNYFEYSFVRQADALRQFISPDAKLVDGTPVLDQSKLGATITSEYGSSVDGTADKYDLADVFLRWTFRFDNAKWNPQFRYLVKSDGTLTNAQLRNTDLNQNTSVNYKQAVIIADSNNPDSGKALALYSPASDINTKQVVTRKYDGEVTHLENRIKTSGSASQQNVIDSKGRLAAVGSHDGEDMSVFGITDVLTGLLNPRKLNTNTTSFPDTRYESLRNEIYILEGTPNQIKDAIARIDGTTDAYDVLVLAGQSNAVGVNSAAGGTYQENPAYEQYASHVFQLSRGDNNPQIVPAVEPLNNQPLNNQVPAGSKGFAYPFALRYAAAHPDRKVLIIPAAQGGTNIYQWNQNPNDYTINGPARKQDSTALYNSVRNRVQWVLDQYPGSAVKAILWQQGEADTNLLANTKANISSYPFLRTQASGYQQQLETLRANMRKDFNAPCAPFMAGEMTSAYGADDNAVLQAKSKITYVTKQVMQNDSCGTSAFVSSGGAASNPGNLDGGSIHFSAPGQFLMARHYWAAYQNIVNNHNLSSASNSPMVANLLTWTSGVSSGVHSQISSLLESLRSILARLREKL